MRNPILMTGRLAVVAGALAAGILLASDNGENSQGDHSNACNVLPSYSDLKAALKSVAPAAKSVNGGLRFQHVGDHRGS